MPHVPRPRGLGLASICVHEVRRQAAREAVAAYHESQLPALVERVGAAIDCFRGGELDAFDVDQVLFQYSRAGEGTVEVLQPWRPRAGREYRARAANGRLVG